MSSKAKKGKKKGGKKKPEPEPEVVESTPTIDGGLLGQENDVEYIKPENQLELTEEQLEEEVQRVLVAKKPANTTAVKFNYHAKTFKELTPFALDNLYMHFSMDGNRLFKSSDKAKDYMNAEEEEKEARTVAAEEAKKRLAEGGEDIADEGSVAKNAFDYSQRAAQTFKKDLKDSVYFTNPPATVQTSGSLNQWSIHDMYMQEYQKMKDMEARDLATKAKIDLIHSEKMGKALKTLERMANMNANYEIYEDFKYWEDASDQFRDGDGTLLPLWRFCDDRTKRRTVTHVVWNPVYPDFFAVSFGSYEFMKQRSGMICCYTLKNTSTPEYVFTTESGVMCMDFHPQHHSLLAVGCYDGTCLVFDVRRKVDKPIYISTIKNGKHTDPVWQVTWQEEDIAKNMNFFSISTDGTVRNWIMTKSNSLKSELIMELKLTENSKGAADEDTTLSGLAGGCCFDFNKHSEHLFIVGTEEGYIHKCSKAYSGQYLATYKAHHMAVYAVKWNPYHKDVFLSCSADWTVKLWDHNVLTPLKSYDLFVAVGDIAWAPFSSTVFAAVASDGKVHVYDLNVNKHEPICEQKVVKRAKLTKVAFNQNEPVIVVGDDRGATNALKLSPNLRCLPKNDAEQLSNMEAVLQACDAAKPTST
eukprot:g1174.t1